MNDETNIKRKKLLLINVVDTAKVESTKRFIPIHRLTSFQSISLAIIAALTPKNWDVELIDEDFEEFKYTDADFVGISAYSTSINRAYYLSELYKKKNIPVVIGGVHATLYPEETLEHCDSIVTGEAEDVWPEVMVDFDYNNLKCIYNGGYTDLNKTVKPDRSIFEKYDCQIATVEFSRGCPFNCSFCGVPLCSGNKYRHKPVSAVIEELKEITQHYVIFKDDNFIGSNQSHKEKVIELFREIIRNKIKKDFLCFVSINIAKDEKVLKLARKAGFVLFFIGIESEKIKGINFINKIVNVEAARNFYKVAFRKIHRHRIAITAAFICAFDTDTPEDVDERAQFIRKSSLDTFTYTFLTPLPETSLFKSLKENGRLIYSDFPGDWLYYNFCHLTFRTLHGNNTLFEERYYENLDMLHTEKFFTRKLIRSFFNTKSMRTTVATYVFNKHNHVFLKKAKFLSTAERYYNFFKNR